jgi:transposase
MEAEVAPRKPDPSDVSDEEWAFVVPYLTRMTPDAPQRRYALREVFNATRWIVRSGAPWRMLPTNFPPWEAVYQQTRRWINAGVFAEMTHDLRELLRWTEDRDPDPSAVVFDSTPRQSTPESGARAGYDGYKRKKGSKGHLAVDTLGNLLALHVTPPMPRTETRSRLWRERCRRRRDRRSRSPLSIGGDTGAAARDAAAQHGIDLVVVKLEQASGASCCCPGAGWSSAALPGPRGSGASPKDYERLPETAEGLYFLAFASLMLHQLLQIATQSP